MKAPGRFLIAALLITAFGCGKKAETPASTEKAPAAPAPAGPVSVAGGDSTGVPECDAYIKNYSTCLDSKVPEASRAALRQAFDQTRETWKKAAADPNMKAALATGCKQANDAAKTAMTAYGCTF